MKNIKDIHTVETHKARLDRWCRLFNIFIEEENLPDSAKLPHWFKTLLLGMHSKNDKK